MTISTRAISLESLSRAAGFLYRPRLLVLACAATAIAFELITVLTR